MSVLSVALLLAVVITASLATLTAGAFLVSQAQEGNQVSQAELALAEFDSQASLVALNEEIDSRTVDLGSPDSGQYTATGNGRVVIEVEGMCTSGNGTEIANASLGTLKYTNDRANSEVVYQGGGVWKKTEGGTTMISPPEYHYNGQTLTFPIVQISASEVNDGEVTITSDGTVEEFPTATTGECESNPIEEQIIITIHSEYYDAWGNFYEERVEGVQVERHPDDEKIVVTLGRVTLLDGVSDGVTTTGANADFLCGGSGISIDGSVSSTGTVDCDSSQVDGETSSGQTNDGIQSVDGTVSEEIDTAENKSANASSNYTRIDGSDPPSRLDSGKYYMENLSLSGQTLVLDVDEGNIELYVDGNITLTNGANITVVNAPASNNTTYTYLEGHYGIKNSKHFVAPNTPPDTSNPDLNSEYNKIYATSDSDFAATGGSDTFFEGVFYAARSGGTTDNTNNAAENLNVNSDKGNCDDSQGEGNGGGSNSACVGDGAYLGQGTSNVYGALITGETSVAQNGGLTYDEDLADEKLTLATSNVKPPRLNYMHVNINAVNVTSDDS